MYVTEQSRLNTEIAGSILYVVNIHRRRRRRASIE